MTIKRLFSSWWFLAVETTLLIFLPLLLIYLYPHIYQYRAGVLVGSMVYIFFLVKSLGLTQLDLGLTTKNIVQSSRALIIPTLLCMGFVYVLDVYFNESFEIPFLIHELETGSFLLQLVLYAIVSAPLQELVFRTFYIARLERVTKNHFFLVFFNATVFALIHLPFDNALFIGTTFVWGVVFTVNYLRYRTFYPLAASHMIVGSYYLVRMIHQ